YCYSAAGKLLWDEVNWAPQPTCGAAYDFDGDGIKEVIVGNDYSSAVIYHGQTGKILRSIRMSGHAGPTALAAGDIDGDGKGDLIVGDRAGRLTFCVPWNGKQKSIEVGASFTKILLGDPDADGKEEVFACSTNGYVYALDATGKQLWIRNLGDVPSAIAALDVNGDKRPELILGSEGGELWILDAQGNRLSSHHTRGPVKHMELAELNGKATTREIVVACEGGYVESFEVKAVRK
ncbi:MAG: FG-GAP-like repeat-containing protein, partial [Planctomycetota bacterium]|nr:FG-GAP-like repeat-containing protein [Planctomycetota bacterium]